MPRKKKPTSEQSKAPIQFNKDNEYKLTEMQSSFVWHYTEGACGMTEAARKAGYEFPSASANKLLNGKDYPNVVKAIRIKQDELAERYAITPQKTGEVYKDDIEWKAKGIPESDIRKDVRVIMPSLDLFGETK
jgi:ribosomal protein S12 methylthiotransferase accessory factor YcaO